MVTEQGLRHRIAGLVNGERSISAFERDFEAYTLDAHLDSTPTAVRLVGDIHLRLAEHSLGHLSPEELLEELTALAIPEPASSASSDTIAVAFSFGVVDVRLLRPITLSTLPARRLLVA